MKIANVRLMLLAIVLTIAGFFLFQQLLSGKTSAYTSEIAAAFLGTMLTIVITAIMLNKQTEIDMQKDRNAKMLEYRWGVYSALNEFLKDLLSSDEPVKKADVVSMQILNQQIAYVGSKDVVDQFSLFVNRFAENGQGKKIPDKSMDVLMAWLVISASRYVRT